MSEKTYLRLIKGGLIASLIIILFVFKGLLFPYITSKQLSFNILIEILFALWLVFVLRYPAYRPRRNFITWGLAAYFLVILISCFTGVDFNLSFWGDAERMLGCFHLFHFFLFFLMIITVFRKWSDWRLFFQSSVAVATLVSLIGLWGANSYSTIGNTAYVSGYLIFNIYFIFLLFFRSSSRLGRWFYSLPLLIMLLEFKGMHTSGAIIGLAVSLLLFVLLLGLAHEQKRIRRWSLGVFLGAVVVIAAVFSQSQSAWFQSSFLRNLTSQKATFQTRLISWKGAAADFSSHPWLGTGFGNYAIIFDRHFTSDFYNHTVGDTYFDRAHNNLIDIVSTTGVFGLLTYLSIFVAAAFYLIREFRANGGRANSSTPAGLNNIEIIVIVSLLAAYFIQNLAIFDSYSTLIGLMMTLGFVYWLNFRRSNEAETSSRLAIKSEGGEIAALAVLLIAAAVFCNHYNVKAWKMFNQSIDGYAGIMTGQLLSGLNDYEQALSGRPLERDARVTLINALAASPELLQSVSLQKAESAFDYVIGLAEKNVAYNPSDSVMQLQLAQILDAAARFYYGDQEKFAYYSGRSLEAIDASIAASPQRATVYFLKSQIQLLAGDRDGAIASTKYGISLNPQYYEGHCRLSQTYLFLVNAGDDSYSTEAKKELDSCLDQGGLDSVSSLNFLKLGINLYTEEGEYEKALLLSERLAQMSGGDPEIWYNLAKIYFVMGKADEAERAAAQAIASDPTLKSDWPSFKASFVQKK